MAEHSFTVDIAAPREAVYDVWVNPERIPEWTEGMTRITDIAGIPGRSGTRYTAWFGGTAAVIDVIDGERPSRFVWRVRLGLLAAEFDSVFELSALGTRMTETVRTRGLIAWLWNRILSTGQYRGSFRGELQTFGRICEGEPGGQSRAVGTLPGSGERSG